MTTSPRLVIEISIWEIDDNGDDIREFTGLSLDPASTDGEALSKVMDVMYDAGVEAIKRLVKEETTSERRPDNDMPDWDDIPDLIRL